MKAKNKTSEYESSVNEYLPLMEELKSSFYLPDGMQKRQLIHKFNRILVELKFVDKNQEKFLLLTSREKEIIGLLVKGNNNVEVSKFLFISRKTVEQHRKNIHRKLEISCFVELNAYAYAFNLI